MKKPAPEEGIENAETAALLAELGCNEGQGYYWSPAVPEKNCRNCL